MKVEPLSRDNILWQIARSFYSVGETKATYLGIVAEHLRAGCLMLGIADTGPSSNLASSIQLCKQTYRRVIPLFPALLEDEVREELNHLQDLGDLAKIDGHQVSLAPARLLAIDSECSLLLGGGPIDTLPLVLRNGLEVSGRSRILTSQGFKENSRAYPLQRLEDWLGLEDDNMLVWASDFVADKVISNRNDIYPEGLFLWVQGCWRALDKFSGPDGSYLCRRSVNIYGNAASEYGLIRYRRVSTSLRVDAYIVIDRDVARKLQGALRQARQTAEQFIITKVRPGIVELTVRHPIAKQHSKLLLLGWEAKNSESLERGVQKIEFSEKLLPLLLKGFGLIGYELVVR